MTDGPRRSRRINHFIDATRKAAAAGEFPGSVAKVNEFGEGGGEVRQSRVNRRLFTDV